MTGIVKVQYSGAEASCLIECDATAQTITSKIGDLGSESADANFGTAGVLDMADYATLDALVDVIDGYDDYTASAHLGDATTTASGLLDATLYAKPDAAYVVYAATVDLDDTALITWDFAKTHLGLADADRDTTIMIINSASLKANRYAGGRILAAADYTEVLDGPGREELLVENFPINSLTDVRVDTERTFGTSSIVTTYEQDAAAGMLYRTSGTWPSGRRIIQVTYNGGYATVPADLKEAMLEVVAYSKRRFAGSGQAVGTRSQSGDGMTTEYELTIPTNAQRVFESYRDWRFV